MAEDLVAGRACGACTVCCVDLTIDEPALQKLPGVVCVNCLTTGGCGIYETRPQTCRTFYCGWRRMKWVGEALRPDLSGVLIRPVSPQSLGDREALGVSFMLLRGRALKAAGLAEAVAAAVHAGVATYLDIPGPPGTAAVRVRLNERLQGAVRRKDKAGLLAVLKALRGQGRMAGHAPVVLSSRPVGG